MPSIAPPGRPQCRPIRCAGHLRAAADRRPCCAPPEGYWRLPFVQDDDPGEDGALSDGGFVLKQRIGRGNYYINTALTSALQPPPPAPEGAGPP